MYSSLSHYLGFSPAHFVARMAYAIKNVVGYAPSHGTYPFCFPSLSWVCPLKNMLWKRRRCWIFSKEIVESVPDPSAGGIIDLEAEAAENSKRKRGLTKNGTAPAAGEQKKRRKRMVDADANTAREEAPAGAKSEPEGDTAMDEDEDRVGCAESSHRDQDADWRGGFALHSEVMVV